MKQVKKHFIYMFLVLLGVSFITFGLTYIAPGDPVQRMYAASGMMPSEEVLEKTREAMGLNAPFLTQYFNWIKNCLRGDFGISYSMNKPVIDIILNRLWPTLKLSLVSLGLMLIISVPFGILAALKKNSLIDYLIRGVSFLGLSIPSFWLGLILLYVIALKLKWLPVVSAGNDFKRLILPAITLAFAMSAKYTRQVRIAVLEEMNQDYVMGARARGIKASKILWTHVLPNAFVPLITLLGLSLGSLLGGTAIVEVIFSYPGLGNMAVSAITAYDYPLIQAYVLWIAMIYMLINKLVDGAHYLMHPSSKKKEGT